MARLLTISSFVARGHVGNAATTFPLMRRGHDVIAVPTVVLAHHPGHACNPARAAIPDLPAIGRDAVAAPRPYPVNGILVGYLAQAAQAGAVAGTVTTARRHSPGIPLLLDPIAGDDGSLYVDPAIVAAIAAHLLPLADLATPNVTELLALVDRRRIGEAPQLEETEIVALARRLGPPAVVVTSAPARRAGLIANLVVTAQAALRIETRRVEVAVNGTGDLLSAMILAGLVEGRELIAAVAEAAAIVHDIAAATARLGGDELQLAAAQERLVAPLAVAEVTKL